MLEPLKPVKLALSKIDYLLCQIVAPMPAEILVQVVLMLKAALVREMGELPKLQTLIECVREVEIPKGTNDE